jgi:hypothetical protein
MVRQAPWCNQYHINLHIFCALAIAREQLFRRRSHAAQAPAIDGSCQIALFPPRFHLDKGHGAPTPGNQINLSARGLQSLAYDPPTVEAKPPSGNGFAASSASLGLFAAASWLLSLITHLRHPREGGGPSPAV